MEDNSDSSNARNDYLFQHLIAMFQTLAWQQLGKIINPMTGKVEQDLKQARITIDMLRMIKEKTTGNLAEIERKILDGVLMELQMNYVDEQERSKKEPEKEEMEKAETVGAGEDTKPEGGGGERAGEPEIEKAGKSPETKSRKRPKSRGSRSKAGKKETGKGKK